MNAFSQKINEQTLLQKNELTLSNSTHSVGFLVYSGINFAPKVKYNDGNIVPKLFNSYIPEFILQYSCILKNNFGFSLEVPFGIFKRTSYYDLKDYNADSFLMEVGATYIGFSPKIAYLKNLKNNISLGIGYGFKFIPFYYSADHWSSNSSSINPNSKINTLFVPQKNYMIPDATADVLFFINGKKNKQNHFVFGITANLSFVQRMSIVYHTYGTPLPIEATSWGKYGWKSSSIGLNLGYRFMGVKP